MRLKDYDEREEGKRVWLSEKEIQRLLDATPANEPRQDAALLLAARCGLRRKEIVDVKRKDLVDTSTGPMVRVWEGKGDKYRETPAPMTLEPLARGMNKAQSDVLVGVDPSTIYDWVQRARERCHAETGDEGWLFVGPHDLRRSWATQLLENGVLPAVVMAWGGWEDWETFRNHYLGEFTPEAIRRERGKLSWLAGGVEDTGPDASNQGYAAIDTGSNYRK